MHSASSCEVHGFPDDFLLLDEVNKTKDESVVTPGGSFKYVLLDTSGIFLNEWHCTDCIMYIL